MATPPTRSMPRSLVLCLFIYALLYSTNPAALRRRSSANGDLHARLGISPHKKLIFFDVPWFMAESAAPIAAALAKIRGR